MELFTEYVKDAFLSDFALEYKETIIMPKQNGDTFIYDTDMFSLMMTPRENENGVCLFIEGEAKEGFPSDGAFSFLLGNKMPDGIMTVKHDCRWWMIPDFPKSYADIRRESQFMLLKMGNVYFTLAPLVGENYRFELCEGKLTVHIGTDGEKKLSGAVCVISRSTDPYKCVTDAFLSAKESGAIRVSLRKDRVYPDMFRRLGYCTWNTFYRGVSEKGIFEKLDELRNAGITPYWVIIDDGWMLTDGEILVADGEDTEKFPNGLRGCISAIKEKYGVKYVGIWHTIDSYWQGMRTGSPVFEEYREYLRKNRYGENVLSLEDGKNYRYYDLYHGYLRSCGVDFVKVDHQSSCSVKWETICPGSRACAIMHEALERSVDRHFGGVLMNCMGGDMENLYNRPHSPLNRTSDDFFPDRPETFGKHLMQNAYTGLWQYNIIYCDFDMFTSGNSFSVQSALLRAISGGPVYIGDAMGETDASVITPMIDSDGSLIMPDGAAFPVPEQLFCKPDVAQLVNTSGENTLIGVFNLTREETDYSVRLDDLPSVSHDSEYLAYESFSGRTLRVNFSDTLDGSLKGDGVAAWSLIPIRYDDENDPSTGYVLIGDRTKYYPCAVRVKIRVPLREIDFEQ